MYPVSKAWEVIMGNNEHWFESKVVVNDVTYSQDNIMSMSTSFREFSEEHPSVGAALSAEMELTMLRPTTDIPRMARVEPYIRALEAYNGGDPQTATGSLISFNNPTGRVQIDAFSTVLEPQQDLHGQSNPYPPGGGANKLPTPVLSDFYGLDGVTATVTEDGQITLNGTQNGYGYCDVEFPTPLPVGSYSVSWFNGSSNSGIEFSVRDSNKSPAGMWNRPGSSNATYSNTTDTEAYWWRLQINNGAVFSNFKFSPIMVVGSTPATSFSPYSNICPISGFSEVTVTDCGKNLYPYSTIPEYTYGWYSDYTFDGTINKVFIKANTDYILSFQNSANQYVNIRVFDTSKNLITDSSVFVAEQGNGYTLPYNSTTHSFRLTGLVPYKWVKIRSSIDAYVNFVMGQNCSASTEAQLEIGSTATAYEAYTSQTVTIDLDGTRYGGTVNLLTGEMTVTQAIKTLQASDVTACPTTYTNVVYCVVSKPTNPLYKGRPTFDDNVTACEFAEHTANITGGWNSVNAVGKIASAAQNSALWVGFPYGTSLDQMKAALAGHSFTYLIDQPFTVQLTPEQLELVVGQNNIWANTGNLTMTYQDRAFISEWIPQGKFYIDTREYTRNDDDLNLMTLHCYDRMLMTEGFYPDSDLTYPADATDVVQLIADTIGVTVDSRTWDAMADHDYTISLPADYTMREVLSYIAAMYCGNFVMTYDGELLLVGLDSMPEETSYLVDNFGFAITFGGDRICV